MRKAFENAINSVKPDKETGRSMIPDEYDLSASDLSDLIDMSLSGHPAKALCLAFCFGFVMGNRATITRKMKRL